MAYGGARTVAMSRASLLAMGDGPRNRAAIVGDEPLCVPPRVPRAWQGAAPIQGAKIKVPS